MATDSATIYNPFIVGDHLNFPSFTDAFGDLLKREAEILSQGRDTKSNANNDSSKSKSTKLNENNKNEDESSIFNGFNKSNSNNTSIPSTPIPKSNGNRSKLNVISSANNLATKPITPIPCIKNNKPRFMKFNIFNNVSKPQTSIATKNQSRSNKERSTPQLIVTPAPKNKKIKRLSDDHDTDNQHKQDNDDNKDQDDGGEEEEDDEEIVKFNLSSLCTPTANKRYQLRSPAPNDVNGRILCSTPAKFPLVMPPTPMVNKTFEQREEAKCDRFFKKHKPILTPAKKRANPVKLYNPQQDHNATLLLSKADAPFEDEEIEETKPVQSSLLPQALSLEVSMIDFGSNNNNNNNHDNNDNKSFMAIFGSSANKKTPDKPGFLQTLQEKNNNDDTMKQSPFLSFMGNANEYNNSNDYNNSSNDYDDLNENPKENMDINSGSGSPSFFLGIDQSMINPLSSSSVNINTPDGPLNKSKVLDCPLSFGSNPLSSDNINKTKTTSKINQIKQIQKEETPIIDTINNKKSTEEKEESFENEKKKDKKKEEELFKGSPTLSMLSMLTPIKPMKPTKKHESSKINESLNHSLFLFDTSPMKCKTQQRERSKSIDSLDAQFSSIKLNKTKKKTDIVVTPVLMEEDEQKMETQQKEQEEKQEPKQQEEHADIDEDEDELLSDVDVMTDDEFFGTTSDHSTQTRPVVIFQEEDIPKIRYNGKLLSDIACKANNSSLSNISYNDSIMSQSWSFDDGNITNNKLNESCNSAQSDKILYRHPNNIHFNNHNNYSRPLKYDLDSIQLITPMDNLTTSESESDTEHVINTTKKNIMPSFNRSDFTLNIKQHQQQRIIPRLYPKYRLKRKDKNSSSNNRLKVPGQQTIGFVLRSKKNRNNTLKSQEMLKQYKISKLAQNPNYTVCNAHNKTGNLL